MPRDHHDAGAPTGIVAPTRRPDPLGLAMKAVCAAALALMVGVVTVNVAIRAFNYGGLDYAEDFAAYGLAAMTFVGAGLAWRERGFLRVDVLDGVIRGRLRTALDLLWDLCALGFVGVLAWQGWRLVRSSWMREVISTSSGLPMWVPQTLVLAGCGLFVITVAAVLRGRLRMLRDRSSGGRSSDG